MTIEDGHRCDRCDRPTRPGEVRSAFWQDDRLVVVEGIPARVCDGCTEQYYDDATVARLDLLRGDGFREGEATGFLRVPVFRFARLSGEDR